MDAPSRRELRGWVRHRAKLVGLRSSLKNQVHCVLAGAGVQVQVSDVFGPGDQRLLAGTVFAVESRSWVDSLLRMITALDFEIDAFARLVAGRLRIDPDQRLRAPRRPAKVTPFSPSASLETRHGPSGLSGAVDGVNGPAATSVGILAGVGRRL